MNNMIQLAEKAAVAIFYFLFPLFFLTTTAEFNNTNKFYLLAFALIIIVALQSARLIWADKTISIPKTALSAAIVIFLLAQTASLLVASPNKIEALLDPQIGFGVMVCLFIWYLFLNTMPSNILVLQHLRNSIAILAVIQLFTPLGSPLDLTVFLTFFIIYELYQILNQKQGYRIFFASIVIAVLIITALFTTYSMIKSPNYPQLSYRFYWQTAIKSLQEPKTALVGFGVGNYNVAFDRFKSSDFNQTPFWQSEITQSRSFLLNLLTETGLLGFFSFLLILIVFIISAIKNEISAKYSILYFTFFTLVFIFLPPSLPILFLFFTVLALHDNQSTEIMIRKISSLLAVCFVAISLLTTVLIGLYLIKSYRAEYFYKLSLNAAAKNNATDMYNNLGIALQNNPYIGKYHLLFSQINLLVANNLIATKKNNLTDKDREIISQSVQQAIAEAKIAISLNPQRASYWQNLGLVYQNITGLAHGADIWAISSYQRAHNASPVNPQLNLAIGSIYYSQGNWPEAIKQFNEAIMLKADWANFHYNLAWAYYKDRQYDKAIKAMEQTISLIRKNPAEYKKALLELEQFRAKQNGKDSPEKMASPGSELILYKAPEVSIVPKVELEIE